MVYAAMMQSKDIALFEHMWPGRSLISQEIPIHFTFLNNIIIMLMQHGRIGTCMK